MAVDITLKIRLAPPSNPTPARLGFSRFSEAPAAPAFELDIQETLMRACDML